MHMYLMKTNIVANLRHLWSIFHQPHGRTISRCILGTMFIFRQQAGPGCTLPLADYFRP